MERKTLGLLFLLCAVGCEAQSLAGRKWLLREIGSQQVNGNRVYVEFNEGQHRVTGNGGCNGFSGEFAVNGESVTISRVMSTRMACTAEEANRLETGFLRAIEGTAKFTMQGKTLRLQTASGPVVLESE